MNDKPEIEFSQVAQFSRTPTDNGVAGLTETILARAGDTHVATRLLHFEPGTDTTLAGVQVHDFWEEVYILSGDLHDITLGETFEAGAYACRPPGMPHGPWRSQRGCTTFEVRYLPPEGRDV
jgi:ChrR Cupin-like domain